MITAEEFLLNHPTYEGFETESIKKDIVITMIEFAQMHVEAALEKASEDAETDGGDGYGWVDKGSILDAYPLTNIK